MSIVIDRSKTNTNKSVGNQKRFSDRHSQKIKQAIKDRFMEGNMKDIQNGDGIDITIDSKDMEEYTFAHDRNTGTSNDVVPGNPGTYKGDLISKPRSGGGKGRGSKAGTGEGEDDFIYHLNEAEFRDMLFDYLELPKFIKKSLKNTTRVVLERAGFKTSGTPSQLSIVKSYFNSFARRSILEADLDERISNSKSKEEIKELLKEKEDLCLFEESDLRFKNYEKNPVKINSAVMFCVMDISGSMTEDLKSMSKRFFYILYLFLQYKYAHIELRFISHTDVANEVDEQTFFYGTDSGGTLIKSAYDLVADIIKEEYTDNNINIYVAQCTDGDCFGDDVKISANFLEKQLLPMVQYFAYLEVSTPGLKLYRPEGNEFMQALSKINAPNLEVRLAGDPAEIFNIFVDLFRKGQ